MNNLPESISKFFWGDRLEELDWGKHKKYITKTILEKGDKTALKWLLQRVNKNYIKNLVSEKNLDPKSENFWNIYLS